jgi:hypothetical protein
MQVLADSAALTCALSCRAVLVAPSRQRLVVAAPPAACPHPGCPRAARPHTCYILKINTLVTCQVAYIQITMVTGTAAGQHCRIHAAGQYRLPAGRNVDMTSTLRRVLMSRLAGCRQSWCLLLLTTRS